MDTTHNIGDFLYHFPGGLKLRHYKAMSCCKQLPAPRLPLLNEYIISATQHSGSAAEVVVHPGQQVLRGDLLAAADESGARVHAPTSGTIRVVEKRPVPHPSGLEDTCIVLTADGADRWSKLEAVSDYQNMGADELIRRVAEAGIVGLGGAVFPTASKLRGGEQRVHTLILNGAECEPYISCDETLMKQEPVKIIEGALILAQVLGIEKTLIAIEDPMEVCNQSLERAVRQLGAESRIRVIQVPMLYPEGGERQLIQVLSGQEVPAGKLPLALGLLVLNVATAAAIRDAILEGRPLTERVVTVTGAGIREPQNVVARIGTPITELVNFCGGYTPGIARLVMGGPLMGIALASDRLPVVKASNCILALTHADLRGQAEEMPCINCGNCVNVCPASLLPQSLYRFCRADDLDALEKLHLPACIECGCCDYVCPSHIPLVDYFRYGKSALKARAEDRRRADIARQRFERRELRLQQQQAERRARHQRRKQALAGSANKQASITAAIERAKARKAALKEPPGAPE